MIYTIWSYRYFIISSIRNNFRQQFSRSRLGGFWLVLHPLAMVLIYALILSSVLSSKLTGIENTYSYAIYLTAGLLSWTLFSEIVTRCLTIFIDNGNLMKKVVFPRLCLPVIITGTAILNNILLLLAIFLVFFLLGFSPAKYALWLPLLILVTTIFALGTGIIVGVLNVFIRDVGQVVPILLQFGFWLTPIVYTASMIPESYRGFLLINPMYYVSTSYHNVLVFGKNPDWHGFLAVSLFSVFLLFLALFMMRKASKEMVDVL